MLAKKTNMGDASEEEVVLAELLERPSTAFSKNAPN
jgi:hypothetical protein